MRVTLDPGDACGDRGASLTFSVDIAKLPPRSRRLGAEVQIRIHGGDVETLVVWRMEGGRLSVDANLPPAGKRPVFEVAVLEVRDATAAELSGRVPTGRGRRYLLYPLNRRARPIRPPGSRLAACRSAPREE